jgi:hypothetical protein
VHGVGLLGHQGEERRRFGRREQPAGRLVERNLKEPIIFQAKYPNSMPIFIISTKAVLKTSNDKMPTMLATVPRSNSMMKP